MVTYWLIGKKSNDNGASSFHLSDAGEDDESRIAPEELPGELTHYNESQMKAAFSFPLPGSSARSSLHSDPSVIVIHKQTHEGHTLEHVVQHAHSTPNTPAIALPKEKTEKTDKVARVLPNTFQPNEEKENQEKEEDK